MQPVWSGQPWTGPGGGAAFATPAYPQQAPWNPHPGNTEFASAPAAPTSGSCGLRNPMRPFTKRVMVVLAVIAVVFIPLGIAKILPRAVGLAVGGISAFGALLLYGTTRGKGGRGNGGDTGGAGGACGGGGCGDALICMPCAWHGIRHACLACSQCMCVCMYVIYVCMCAAWHVCLSVFSLMRSTCGWWASRTPRLSMEATQYSIYCMCRNGCDETHVCVAGEHVGRRCNTCVCVCR